MKALHLNIKLREHRDRSRTLKRLADDRYTEATGVTDTFKHTGRWNEVLAKAAEIVSEPRDSYEVTCTCTRVAADMGELSVAYAEYKVPEGAETENAADALGTKENPMYTYNATAVQEPLLSHPRYLGKISWDDAWVLQQYSGGAHPDTELEYNGQRGTLREFCAGLSGAAREVYNFYMAQVTHYLEVYAEATARWKGPALGYKIMTICTPPGPVVTPEGRNWIFIGEDVEISGGEVWRTAKFKLSGHGGWSEDLYEKG